MPSHLHLAHRRTARIAAKGRIIKTDDGLDKIRKKCKKDFAAFCEYISEGKKTPAKHHREWISYLVTEEDTNCLHRIGGKDQVILSPRGPLHPDTRVATPKGWTPIKNIQIGDTVYAGDGQPTTVLDAIEYPETDVYKVSFSDGTSMMCDDSHRFAVRLIGTDLKNKFRVVTLQEIRQFVTIGIQGNRYSGVSRKTRMATESEKPWLDTRGYAKYQVPISKAVQYPEKQFAVHPYLLGVLLGDGGLTDRYNINITTADTDIIDFINTILPENHIAVKKTCKTAKLAYTIQHVNGSASSVLDPGRNRFKKLLSQQICDLQLFGKHAHEKFIPIEYLHGSIEQRNWLLKGLMDTDGAYVIAGKKKSYKNRCCLTYGSVSRQLIDNVAELVRSLGGFVTYYKPQSTFYSCNKMKIKSERLFYRIRITLPEGINPFYCQRKKEKYEGSQDFVSRRGFVKSIVDIKYAGRSPVKCLTVEHDDEQFLIDDYIVSMNSAKSTLTGLFTAWAIGIHADAKMPLKILYISYTVDVARPKSAAIKNVVSSKRYQDIFPNVQIKKGMTSNEYWSIDYKLAGIEETGDEQFTVCCAGLKGSITSKRSSLVIIDDCIKAANDIKNPEVRREMQENWNSVIAPTMFEGARAICLGTRFRHDDIFATTFIPRNGWNQVVQQALITDDCGNVHSYWPDMWSLDYLMKKKSTAPISFSFQYMNQIVRQSELSLSPDLLIRAEIATEFDSIGIGVDLSSGTKDKNDYTVMTLGGRIGDKIHVIDYRRFRAMGNLEKLDKMMELLADWNLLVADTEKPGNYFPTFNVCDVWSEAVQYQASLEADFKRICLNEMGLHNLKWHAVKGFKSDKLARFRGIMGLFEQRKIVFNRYRGFMHMFDELTNFGTSGHDDCVDSLVYMVNGLMRRGSLEVDY